MAVIYKLIWYQDGYEQPSEEDLKRISAVSWFFKKKTFKINLINFSRTLKTKRTHMMPIFVTSQKSRFWQYNWLWNLQRGFQHLRKFHKRIKLPS
jgi:hypothetical protein